MAKYYHGAGRAGPYFEGWYLKQQNQRDTLAFIPAWHVDRKGRAQASLQVIANQDCWSLDYPAEAFAMPPPGTAFLWSWGTVCFPKAGSSLTQNPLAWRSKGPCATAR